MKSLKLTAFEVKHQIRSITFIIVLVLFAIFIITQMNGVFHYPVGSNSDVEALSSSGNVEYLFVPASEAELKSGTMHYLQENIDNGSIPAKKAKDFQQVMELLGNNSFDNVYTAMREDEYITSWLRACESQFGQKTGSIKEINHNLRAALGTTGYSRLLYEKYVTYMQISATFLIFPIFLLLFTRDSRCNMSEILYAQPISSTKYILCRYLGALIPVLLFCYGFGILLNMISMARFIQAGWDIEYTFFFKNFAVYLLPTIVFLSAFIMFLMLLLKKAIAVFPVYIAYVIFNVTPKVFENGDSLGVLSRAIIRLDGQSVSVQDVVLNRVIYLVLAAGLIFVACKLYDNLKNNLRKAVTI